MNLDNGNQPMKKQNRYSTAVALTASIAAFEFNSRRVVRDTITVNGIETRSNRQLILDSLTGVAIPYVINDFHYKQAEGLIEYLQQTGLMQTIAKGKTDSFFGSILSLLSETEINYRELGLLAWAPKLADDYQSKDAIREVSAQYESNSRYIGRVGDKITINFTLIEKRYVKNFDSYAVYGHDDDGNLVFYWTKNADKISTQGRIQGRVRQQEQDDRHGNARVTTLNYVKVL